MIITSLFSHDMCIIITRCYKIHLRVLYTNHNITTLTINMYNLPAIHM